MEDKHYESTKFFNSYITEIIPPSFPEEFRSLIINEFEWSDISFRGLADLTL